MALAHSVGDKVEAAYRRGDLFEKRHQLVKDWAQNLNTQETAGAALPGVNTGQLLPATVAPWAAGGQRP